MLLSAVESFVFLILCIVILIRQKGNTIRAMLNPNVLFCWVFSLTFAFAVGVSTFNFGTLARYKIPMLPFLLTALLLVLSDSKSDKKVAELDITE